MRRLAISFINLASFVWKLFPKKLRVLMTTTIFLLESRGKNSKKGLNNLFQIKDKLDWVINETAMRHGQGVHPKHELTKYHYFFINNINDGDIVLDVGCGYGAVSRSIAIARPKSIVWGIDYDEVKISLARSGKSLPNLNFKMGDALKLVINFACDVVILSNVLEHIDNRIDFLLSLKSIPGVKKVLIRVPSFERDWEIALRKELGANYMSDPDHKIEHTLKDLKYEVEAAGWVFSEHIISWGEIWACCYRDSDKF